MISTNLQTLQPYLNRIKGSQGSINITLNNMGININNKSGVGDALETWIGSYISSIYNQTSVSIRPNPFTQEFPDYFLQNSNGLTTNLEIKTFDASASPNFDIGNFQTYVDLLSQDPKKLDSDYLIVSYTLNNGTLIIQDLWFKNVWEISTNSANWDLKLQVKRNMIYNIRPATWYSQSATYTPFNTKEEFIDAIQNVLDSYHITRGNYTNWSEEFWDNY